MLVWDRSYAMNRGRDPSFGAANATFFDRLAVHI
jgi:hypothetical protein